MISHFVGGSECRLLSTNRMQITPAHSHSSILSSIDLFNLIAALFEHEENKKSNKVQFILVAALANVINSPNFIPFMLLIKIKLSRLFVNRNHT